VRDGNGREFQITGVVGDVRFRGLDADLLPAVYLSQAFSASILVSFAVRTSGDAMGLIGPVRRVIRELDPNQRAE
jgi:hypothetical protein